MGHGGRKTPFRVFLAEPPQARYFAAGVSILAHHGAFYVRLRKCP